MLPAHGIPTPVFFHSYFPPRFRSFSEASALFHMYKSEGPISKTREAPRSNAGVAEMMRGKGRRMPKKASTRRPWPPVRIVFCLSPARARHVTVPCPRPPQVIGPAQRDLFLDGQRLLQRYDPLPLREVESHVCASAATHGHPFTCHAFRHPTCRDPNHRAPIWVRPASWTGAFRRTSSRERAPRSTSRKRAIGGLPLLQECERPHAHACKSRAYVRIARA